MRIVLTDVEYTAKGKFKLPIAVVARQIGPIWNDYCGNGEAESERCNFLRNLMKPDCRANPENNWSQANAIRRR